MCEETAALSAAVFAYAAPGRSRACSRSGPSGGTAGARVDRPGAAGRPEAPDVARRCVELDRADAMNAPDGAARAASDDFEDGALVR
jgi:hypothetical protein